MSGYLRRLAERALGQSRPLRALTPQRWSGEEAPVPVDEPSAQLPSQGARPEAVDPFRHAPPLTAAPHQPPAAHPGGVTDPEIRAAPSRTVAAPSRQPDARLPDAPLQNHHMAARADADGDGAASSPLPPTPWPLMAMQPIQRAMPSLEQPRPTAQQEEHPLSGADEAQQDSPAVRLPAPLLPRAERHAQVPAPHLALRPRLDQAAARQPAGAVEETTEVHVTIGRIEVTAVQETSAQKHAPRRRPAPMSLDEYIARRQGGRA